MDLPSHFELNAYGRRWRVTCHPVPADPRAGAGVRAVWRATSGDAFVEVEHRPDESRKALKARLRARLAGPRNTILP